MNPSQSLGRAVLVTPQLGVRASTAQRGTAAALIVATQNFDDARVLIVITIVNTLGIVLVIAAAEAMARDSTIGLLPAVADPPPARDRYDRFLAPSAVGSSSATTKGQRP